MSQSLNILIVEDSLSFALELELVVAALGHKLLATVDNSSDALIEVLDKKPDLILMDINISGKYSGIDVAKKIEQLNIPVIFITSFADDKHFDDAAQISNSTYLVKPVEQFTLKAAISILMNKRGTNRPKPQEIIVRDKAIFLKKKKDFDRIDVNDILYVESSRVYCKTFTSAGAEYMNRMTLNEYADLIKEFNFLRPHRSYLVNADKVTKVNLSENYLKVGSANIPISRNSKNEVKEHFRFII